jgi:type I restriction enzyme S subunit
MKNWAKISDYLFFQEGPGVRNSQYTTSGVKLINVANLVDGNIDLSTSDRYISENEAYGRYKHFLVDEGDFIIASSGIKVEYFDQKMGFVSKRHLPLCMNTSTIRFKSLDKSKLNIRYFMYYLKSKSFKRQLFKQITGSAQLNFGPSHLKKMKFLITDLSSQNTIVSILDNIDDQIRNKKDQLIEYDQLIKSRFVEMFGVITQKENGFTLGDVCLNMVRGPFGSSLKKEFFVPEGPKTYKVYEQKHAINKNADTGDYYISNQKFDELRRFEVKPGDIIMSCSGTIGALFVIPENAKPGLINQALLKFELDESLINHEYFIQSMELIISTIESKGSGIANITSVNNIKKTNIFLPTMDEQNKFTEFVKHIDKLKFAVQKSLDETQMLFDSLLQEYFG